MRILPVCLIMVSCSLGNSVVLSTFDSGASWQREEINCLYSLNSVSIDLATGYVIAAGDNGAIFRRNQENLWIDVSPPGVNSNLNSVATGVNGVYMACGDNGTVLSSFDRGATWRVWNGYDFNGIDLLSVNFDPTYSESFVITGEDGFIFTSEEGVQLSSEASSIVGSSVKLCGSFPEIAVSARGSVFFFEEDSLVSEQAGINILSVTSLVSAGAPFAAAGASGEVYVFSESGWNTCETGIAADLRSIAYIDFGRVLCAVGDDGVIVLSTDTGESWSVVPAGTSRDLNCVAGDGSGTGFIVGESITSDWFFQ